MLNMFELMRMKSILLGFFAPDFVNYILRWFCKGVKCPSHINCNRRRILVHWSMYIALSFSVALNFSLPSSSSYYSSLPSLSFEKNSPSDSSSAGSSPISTYRSSFGPLFSSIASSLSNCSLTYYIFLSFINISSFAFFSVKYFFARLKYC